MREQTVSGDVTAATRVACIIGSPVVRSLSPAIQNAAFRAAGLDWVYAAFDVPPERLTEAVAGMRGLGIAGANVTMPHKRAVAPLLDELSGAAAATGSVNTIVNRDGRLIGESTDGDGFVQFLREDAAVEPSGRRVLLLGAGGAAGSLCAALSESGADVAVAARKSAAAESVAAAAGGRSVSWEQRENAAADADLIVNATPAGSDGTATPLSLDRAAAGAVVVDLIYAPAETPLLRIARNRGIAAHNGLGMLVRQAALAFEHWTGLPAPLDAMRTEASERIAAMPPEIRSL